MWDIVRQFLEYNLGFLATIFQRIDQILAFWTFLAIGLVCGGFVLATFVLGEVGEFFGDLFGGHDGDFSIGHDVSVDHDMSGGVEHDLGHAGHSGEISDMPSILSFRVILMFFSGFGIAGAISTHFENGLWVSILFGIATGVVMGILLYLFMLLLACNQGSINITVQDIVGKEARVINQIPSDGIGQIQLDTPAGTLTKLSRSSDNLPIPENSLVKIESVVGQIAVVKRRDAM